MGKQEYLETTRLWRQQLEDDACQLSVLVTSCQQVEANVVLLRYNMSWTPARAAWLEEVGKLPWIKVQRRDLLHELRKKSRFSWTSVGLFFRKLVLERELIIPQAVIRANAQLTFQLEGAELTSQAEGAEAQARRMKLVRQSEDFELLDSLMRGELQNRVLCYDLLQFLDARRPKVRREQLCERG